MRLRLSGELVRYGWRRQTTYRGATVAGLFTNSVFAFIQGAVLLAAIRGAGGNIGGYDTTRALTYTWLAQALIGPIGVFRWSDIADRVKTGEIATDFSRPADLQHWFLAIDLGRAGASTVFRAVPQFLIGALLFELVLPGSVGRWLLVAVSLTLAVVVSFGLRFIANLAVFWTLEPRGVLNAHSMLLVGLSGFIIPLTFFPDGLAQLLRLLPWASAIQAPIDVFLDQRSAAAVIGVQLFWIIALVAAGQAVQRAAQTKLVVQGG